jgi:hypothetical protein
MSIQVKIGGGPPSDSPAVSLQARFLQGVVIALLALCLVTQIRHYHAYAQAQTERQICYRNLQLISAAFMKYRNDHNGRLPRQLLPVPRLGITESETLYPRYIKSIGLLICPTESRFWARKGLTVDPNRPTYDYVIQQWVQDAPGHNPYPSSVFYKQIVPANKENLQMLTCTIHPDDGSGQRWAIMWDGSIKLVPFAYDPGYGWWRRDPEIKADMEMEEKRGMRLP